ncbi:anti-sigma factor RsbA family regulatory protein [Actinomadura syzygii]|uniref:Sensor histidine kinase n=1 Tax=Actinomadura syzygii TaxID=1427538 RepID=A0A5D0UGU6_9ACTN|nr:sensor histidine kinase [Actinomadura syzygii]TYC17297.1 sensor histidine kinase [Actinomadura syzygii]
MTTSPAGTAASDSFTHRVLPYDGPGQLLAGAVPFLLDGVDAGDRVLAVSRPDRESLLRDALGPAAEGIEFADAATWYEHPSRTLADCLSDADDTAWRGRRLRVLGDPVWARRSRLEVVEWQRVEAVLNVAFRGTGAALLCPYEASLPAGVVAAARRTHPETVRGARAVPNPGYVDPWTYSAGCDAEPLPRPPAGADTLKLERPDLFWLRAYVTDYARSTPLPEDDLQRLLVAVTEVVTNAWRHGEPPIVMRMWTEAPDGVPALVCEVCDSGRWTSDSGYGLIPPRPGGAASGGRFGLWAVRLLCSIVQIRTGDGGSVVRLRLALPEPGAKG